MKLSKNQKIAAAGGGIIALGVLALSLSGDKTEIQPLGGGGGGMGQIPVLSEGHTKKDSGSGTFNINYPEVTPYVSTTPDFSSFFSTSTTDTGPTPSEPYRATPEQTKKLVKTYEKQSTVMIPKRNLHAEQMEKVDRIRELSEKNKKYAKVEDPSWNAIKIGIAPWAPILDWGKKLWGG